MMNVLFEMIQMISYYRLVLLILVLIMLARTLIIERILMNLPSVSPQVLR